MSRAYVERRLEKMRNPYVFTPAEFQGPQIKLREFSCTVGQEGRLFMSMPNRMSREDWAHIEEVVALIMRSVRRGVHLEQQP